MATGNELQVQLQSMIKLAVVKVRYTVVPRKQGNQNKLSELG